MTTFNIYLDIAAIFIFFLTIMIYEQQNYVKNRTHYAFLWMWFFAMIATVFDIGSVHSMKHENVLLFHVANTLYYVSQQWIAYCFFRYALIPLWRRETISRIKQILLDIPVVAISIFILVTPYTGLLYEYSFITGIYIHGPLQFVPYVTAMFYYLSAIHYVAKRRDLYNSHIRHAMNNSVVIVALGLIAQIIWPEILTHSFTISLCMLELLIVSLKHHAIKDKESGLLNAAAFYEKATNLSYNDIPFNVIAIRMSDFEILLSTYGKNNLHDLDIAICHEVTKYTPKNQNYYISDDMITAIIEYQSPEELDEMKQNIASKLEGKWRVNGIDMSFSYFLTSFTFKRDFKDSAELRSLVVYLERTHKMKFGIMDLDEFAIKSLHREADVEQAILAALQDKTFEMYYQPICDLSTGKFTSAEALIRLHKSIIGPVGPDEFIPIAEKAGLIIQIGEFVLDSVFKFVASNDFSELGVDYIELNLSTIQCLQRDFLVELHALKEKYKIDPSRICFEITETASNSAPEIFHSHLAALHDEGYRLAIDDFGTGYGNLQRLLSMDFDLIKFDKDTIHQFTSDAELHEIYDKLVNMMHSMGSKVVAEGVETDFQHDFILASRTNYIQGFYYSKPVPEDQYIEFLKAQAV